MSTPPDATGAIHTIAGALLTIGNDSAAVAEILRTYGCRGIANNPADNPLTNFLARYGVREPEVAWNGRGYVCQSNAYEHEVCVPLPDPVAMFMAQFDAGQWPNLAVNS
ncbi:hypothetical protein ACIA5D_17735 [Actinoplanes sp. NPDC051513]|uniref:hypothetical protein n=1 Tax=Actinoplanes sp. NPDC051513 TaxID=3363908 RepID=UPI0037AF091D